MSTPPDSAKNRPARDRQQTEQAILDAVASVLVRDGFASLGINSIAREANIDKVLIYRYFGGMPELLQAFGSHGGFWPTVDELFADVDMASLPFEQRLRLFFERTIDALRSRPLTLEIVAMEVGAPNVLSDILNTMLEQWGADISGRLAEGYDGDINRLHIVTTTLFAGIQYLMLRSRGTALFGGIPIREDEGWQSVKQSLGWLCTLMVDEQIRSNGAAG